MNTIISMSNFCEFETIDGFIYECKNCGNRIAVYDDYSDPPVFLCKNSLKRQDAATELEFVQKIKNFGKSVVNHALKGFPTCTEEQIVRRHNICMSCEYMKDNTCSKCGCPLIRNKVYVSKLAWADESCPIGKWTEETTS